MRALAGARAAPRHSVGGPVAAVLGRFASGPHPLVTTLVAQLDDFVGAVRGERRRTSSVPRPTVSR